jgi:hypothetical protein
MVDHPAIVLAQEIHGRPGDLNPQQQHFLDEVGRIGWDKIRNYQTANFIWGDLPRQYRLFLERADRRCADELAAALDNFEASLEDI